MICSGCNKPTVDPLAEMHYECWMAMGQSHPTQPDDPNHGVTCTRPTS